MLRGMGEGLGRGGGRLKGRDREGADRRRRVGDGQVEGGIGDGAKAREQAAGPRAGRGRLGLG